MQRLVKGRLPQPSRSTPVTGTAEEEEQWEKDEEGFFGDLQSGSGSASKSRRQLDRQRRMPEGEVEGSGLRADRVGMDPALSAAQARQRIRDRVRENNAKRVEQQATGGSGGRSTKLRAKIEAKFERKKARKEEAAVAKLHSKKVLAKAPHRRR
jgi:hypothetical protein